MGTGLVGKGGFRYINRAAAALKETHGRMKPLGREPWRQVALQAGIKPRPQLPTPHHHQYRHNGKRYCYTCPVMRVGEAAFTGHGGAL